MTRKPMNIALLLAVTACGSLEDASLDVAFRTHEPVVAQAALKQGGVGDVEVTSVVVEVLSIEASFVDEGWVTLEDEPQSIDLIGLEDGSVGALNDALVHPGHLDQVRLMLGDENTLVVDDETLPLRIPSGAQTGLKIPVDEEIVEGESYALDLRWEIERNLVHSAQGWQLKPVLHVESFDEEEPDAE